MKTKKLFVFFLFFLFCSAASNNVFGQQYWNSDNGTDIYNDPVEGNVGIGTYNPMAKLHVIGDLRLEGTSYFSYSASFLGNIGIGTTSPANKLHISDAAPLKIRLDNPTGTYNQIFLTDVNGMSLLGIHGGQNGYWQFQNLTDNLTLLKLMNTGNVGIGTDNPSYKLDVNGSLNANGSIFSSGSIGIGTNSPSNSLHITGSSQIKIRMDNPTGSNNRLFWTDANGMSLLDIYGGQDGYWDFQNLSAGTSLLRLMNNGDVGIGKENPVFKLDVNGIVNATDFKINGQPLSSSQWITSGSNIYYNAGKVGIGTTNPLEQLQLGDRFTFHNGGQKIIGYNFYYDSQDKRTSDDEVASISFTDGGDLNFRTAPYGTANSTISWTQGLFIKNDGNVCIGTTTPYVNSGQTSKLSLNGTLTAKEIYVKSTGWSDFVFKEGYILKPLEELESYIKENNKLPEIPSESEVVENGINVQEMTAKLLQKVEELTLYVIEQKKEIEKLKEDNSKLNSKVFEVKK